MRTRHFILVLKTAHCVESLRYTPDINRSMYDLICFVVRSTLTAQDTRVALLLPRRLPQTSKDVPAFCWLQDQSCGTKNVDEAKTRRPPGY